MVIFHSYVSLPEGIYNQLPIGYATLWPRSGTKTHGIFMAYSILMARESSGKTSYTSATLLPFIWFCSIDSIDPQKRVIAVFGTSQTYVCQQAVTEHGHGHFKISSTKKTNPVETRIKYRKKSRFSQFMDYDHAP